MNDSIIEFYILTNKLKEKIRTGWMEVEISSDRLESVAEHVYGCMMLAIAVDSEYKLGIDMNKALKMIALHELEETLMKDYTLRDNITPEEKIKLGKECVEIAVHGLVKKNEIIDLLDEFNAHETKEAKFCYHIDKIECDFQAKLYDLKGEFDLKEAIKDFAYYSNDELIKIKDKVRSASDVWIEYDRKRYDDDCIFKYLLNDIQKLKSEDLYGK